MRRERGLRGRRLRQHARRRVRRDDRRLQAAVGRQRRRFKTVSCVEIAKDGTVYVCDRGNNRVQAFDKTGKFLKEGVVAKDTRGTGTVWDVAFSNDPQQRYLFVADGHDQKIVDPSPRHAGNGRQLWRRRSLSRARSIASAASRSIRAATSTRAKPRGQARPEVPAEGRPLMPPLTKRHVLVAASFAAALMALGCRRTLGRARAAMRQIDGRRHGAALSKSTRCGRRSCRIIGSSVRPSACRSMRRITCGSSIATICSARTKRRPARSRRRRRAASRRRPSSSSIPPATWSATGEARGKATTGRSRITASPSITRATSGSARTRGATRTS